MFRNIKILPQLNILSPCSCQTARKKRGQKQFRVNSYSATSISGSFVSMQNCHQSVAALYDAASPEFKPRRRFELLRKKEVWPLFSLECQSNVNVKGQIRRIFNDQISIRMRCWGTWLIYPHMRQLLINQLTCWLACRHSVMLLNIISLRKNPAAKS